MNSLLDKVGIFFVSSYNKIKPHFNGMCYLNKDIIVGEKAFVKYIESNNISEITEGRFTAIYKDDVGNWNITTDSSGQGVIYYFNDGSNWAASNSFLFLAEQLNKLGISLSFNYHVLLGFRAFHSSTEQLISENTLIKEIKVLPLHKKIKIINNKLFFYSISLPLSSNYVNDLIHYRDIYSSRIRALSDKFNDDVHVDITGGYDSRAILSLIIASGADLDKLNFRSNRRIIEDFSVASNLAEKYKFKIKNKGFNDKAKYASRDVFNIWKYGNLGVYFPVYMEINNLTQTRNFHLHGAGGGSLRGLISDVSPNILATRLQTRIMNLYSKELVGMFKDEFILGAKQAGIKGNDTLENVYYSYYRSRFHFGRNQFRNLYSNLVTPLTSTWLYHINERGLNAKSDHNIFIDLMLLSDNELPCFDFDRKEKNFSKQMLESSYFYKNSVKPTNYNFNIYFEKENELSVVTDNIDVDPYELLCEEISKIISSGDSGFLIDKPLLKIALNEISSKQNLAKNYKILSFYFSLHEISKLCKNKF